MGRFGDTFGINTYSYTQDMTAADCLRHLAEQGVKAVELMFFPGHLWVDDPASTLREVRSVLERNGMTLMSVNGPNIDLNIASATEEMRALSLSLNNSYLRIAGELGAGGLVLGPGKANPLFPLPLEILEGHFHRALDQLIPIAEASAVEIFVENMPFAFLPDVEGLMGSLARYGNEDLRFCYDAANGYFIGEDPGAGLKKVASRLALVHISDTTQKVYKHDAVGLGDMDFSQLPRSLCDVGYDQPALLEIISRNADKDILGSIAALKRIGF